jgi:hypothetical protein
MEALILLLIGLALIRPLVSFIVMIVSARTDTDRDRHNPTGHLHDARTYELLEGDLLEHDRIAQHERVSEEAWVRDDTYAGELGEDDGSW